MQVTKKPRYSIRKYLLLAVLGASVGVIAAAIILSILGNIMGFGCQGVLVVILLSFPIWFFSLLYGFYKGLIRHYGFKGDEKLFFGGKF